MIRYIDLIVSGLAMIGSCVGFHSGGIEKIEFADGCDSVYFDLIAPDTAVVVDYVDGNNEANLIVHSFKWVPIWDLFVLRKNYLYGDHLYNILIVQSCTRILFSFWCTNNVL